MDGYLYSFSGTLFDWHPQKLDSLFHCAGDALTLIFTHGQQFYMSFLRVRGLGDAYQRNLGSRIGRGSHMVLMVGN